MAAPSSRAEEESDVLDAANQAPGEGLIAAGTGRLRNRRLLLGFAGYYLFALLICWLLGRNLAERIVLSIWGRYLVVEQLRDKVLEVAILTLLIMPAVFAVELIAVGWQRSSLRSLLCRPFALRAYGCRLLRPLAQPSAQHSPGSVSPSAARSSPAPGCMTGCATRAGISLSLDGLPLIVQYAGYFLLFTFWDYWQHRLEHSRFFWPIHRYHHGAEEFHILTSLRVHPAAFSRVIAMTLPLALVDAPVSVIAAMALGATILRFIIHSRIDSDFGWIGRWAVAVSRRSSPSPPARSKHAHLQPQPLPGLGPSFRDLAGGWQPEGRHRRPRTLSARRLDSARYVAGLPGVPGSACGPPAMAQGTGARRVRQRRKN